MTADALGERMEAPPSGVKVRMYRMGLGDCFLLAFPRESGPFYMLIDCGVLIGTKDATEKMKGIVADILASTGKRIDVLVATHQHWDHLSGFEQAQDLFNQLEIGEVWVAWTEQPEHPLGKRLRARRETAIRALHAAERSLQAAATAESAVAAAEKSVEAKAKADAALRKAASLGSVLEFFGMLGADGRPSAIQRAQKYVLDRGLPPRYRTPGEPPLPLPGGARAFVLGPPLDEKLLLRSDPSRRASEVYEKRVGLDEETSFFAAALAAAEREAGAAGIEGSLLPMDEEELKKLRELRELKELSFPFDKLFAVELKDAEQDPFFQKHYFGIPDPPEHSEENLSWRRIDGDWLGSAESLALQLDGDTNNTSLVLAIELSPGGKVLLFPGDAQVGNWLSWETVSWPKLGDKGATLTAADLLRRTVLYKVGHHASHNATLRAKGLELMERQDLVAMIPVDETMAREKKKWDMPFGPLYERLLEKTSGRVLRADLGIPNRPDRVSEAEWEEKFRKYCERDEKKDLWVQITIPAEDS